MASQHGALAFIDEGSTRRKEIIAKFLDLEIFEKKFKLAKEDCTDLKGALRRLESRNYDEEIEEASTDLELKSAELDEHKVECENLKEEIEQITTTCEELRHSIDAIPEEIINVVDTNREIRKKTLQVNSLESENKQYSVDLSVKRGISEKIDQYISKINIETLTTQQNTINSLDEERKTQQDSLGMILQQIEDIERKSLLLDGIPCGTDYPQCKFIRDANVAVANLPHVEKEQKSVHESLGVLNKKIESMRPEFVFEQIKKYDKILEKKNTITNEIADLNLSIERNQSSIERLGYELKELGEKKQKYEENKEAIENFEEFTTELDACESKLEKAQLQYDKCQLQTLELYKDVGSLEQKVASIQDQKQEYIDLQEEYSAYDLYMRCMHTSGIAYDIIKRKLPVINQEIAKVLANIVDFEIFFEDSGKKFDIFIKHPRHEPRPIEMASGAEKTLCAMAIRLALLSVSSLPKSDLFILDEPGTALDEENMEGFIRILELIKVYFKNVLLISHLDSLKDCVDMQIVIEKKLGYARVNQ
jgi:exonuclease SbcC